MEHAMSRPKTYTLSARELDAIKAREFIRGSALTVAHYHSVWGDDNLAIAFSDLVRSNISRTKPDPKKYSAVVVALCERYDIELQGDREIIELVYEATIKQRGAGIAS